MSIVVSRVWFEPSHPPTEILLVVDGKRLMPLVTGSEVRVLSLPARGGPARARNLGARSARGDILFFVDADVTIPSDAIDRLDAAFGENPQLAAIIGSYDDSPAELNFLSQYKNLLHHYIHQTAQEEASTFWGACGAIRRDVFVSLGGFDESYRQPSIEDIELGYRLKRTGGRIGLCRDLQVKHLKRWTPTSLLVADFFRRALPWAELIFERGFINDLNLRHADRISVALSWASACALICGVWSPVFIPIAGALSLLLLLLNIPVYRFFRRKRGLVFVAKAIPWHWSYYLYSGLAFAIAGVGYVLRKGWPWTRRQKVTMLDLDENTESS